MDPNYPPQATPPPQPTGTDWRALLAIGLCVILVIALAGAALLYWREKNAAADLQARLDKVTLDAYNAARKQTTDPISGADYTASFGNFRVSLPDPYFIVVDRDGGFEGGPVTRLAIATKISEGTQTVLAPEFSRVDIKALSLQSSSYEQSKAALLKDRQATKESPLSVDGVQAETYVLKGLFDDKAIIFQRDGIFYAIIARNYQDEQVVRALDETIKGFSFSQ